MLTRLTLVNFQAHENLTLDLSHPITTIVGATDVGKSALFRAVRWLVFNRPSGTSMLRWDAKGATRVVVELDGASITRFKSKDKNTYTIAKGKHKKTYQAIGTRVPEDVAKLLNLGDVNFQRQHDPPFWFTDPASKVAAELNKIVNLEVIDNALSFLASASRKAEHVRGSCQARLAEAESKLDDLARVPDMLMQHARLLKARSNAERKAASVADLAAQLEKGAKILSQHETATEAAIGGRLLVERAEKITKLQERQESLAELVQNLESATRLATRRRPELAPLEGVFAQAEQKNHDVVALEGLIAGIVEKEQTQCRLTKSATDLAQQIKTKFRHCPVCGKPMSSPSP